MTTISRFAQELKDVLHAHGEYKFAVQFTGCNLAEVDWEELDAAIDKFCAEFKAKQVQP